MSMGNSPADRYIKTERLMAKADADRTARLAGCKPLVERLLERLRPHRQRSTGDLHGSQGNLDDPGD